MRTSMTVGGAGATTERELGELKVRLRYATTIDGIGRRRRRRVREMMMMRTMRPFERERTNSTD
jgi:hypothetical protein